MFLQVLNDENIDIACIQETWFNSETNTITSTLKEAGYNIAHMFRTEKRGTGVAIIWKEKFQSKKQICKIQTKTYDSLQYQCMSFNFKPKLLVISIYRLQEIPFKQFLVDLEDLMSDHFNNSHSLIVVGDFNTHFEHTETPDNILLSGLMSSYGLSQLINGPTHKRGHTLDLVFLNMFEVQSSITTPIDFGVGDHFPVYLKLNNVQNGIDHTTNRKAYRNLRGINLAEFSSEICSQLDDLHNLDFPTHYQNFFSITNETLNRHAPLKIKTVSTKKEVPWLDSEYHKERALRRKYEREWKKSIKNVEKLLVLNEIHMLNKGKNAQTLQL